MTLRERYHVALAEGCGKMAAWMLKRCAMHAYAIADDLTFYRVKEVLRLGVRLGWHPDDPTRHVRPRRPCQGSFGPVGPTGPIGRHEPSGMTGPHPSRPL